MTNKITKTGALSLCGKSCQPIAYVALMQLHTTDYTYIQAENYI